MQYRTLCLLLLAGAASVAARAGNFEVDPAHSELAVDAHASPGQDFTCEATAFDVDLQLDPDSLQVESAVCSFAFADLDSHEEKRDAKMCRWMEIDFFPTARFELENVRPVGDHFVATGRFRMHGISHEIEVPFTVQRQGENVVLEGSADLDTRDWGLDKIRLFIFSVNPVVHPRFHLEGHLLTQNARAK